MNNRIENQFIVSIGVPVYNGAKYILETLKSIEQQVYKPLEIIIIDDGSTDNSLKICEDWKLKSSLNIRILGNGNNIGLCKTCNEIIKHARGFYLQIFGQDDIMKPKKIAEDVDFFQKHNNAPAFIFSNVELINEVGKLTGENYYDRINFKDDPSQSVFEKLITQNFIPAPTVLMRTDVVKKLNGFNPDFLYEDWQMWLKLSRDYEAVKHDVCNVHYRIHRESLMGNSSNESEIIRNRAAFKMFSEYKDDPIYRQQVFTKLSSLAIYSYYLKDPAASILLKQTFGKKFSLKNFTYYLLNTFKIPHHRYWFSK